MLFWHDVNMIEPVSYILYNWLPWIMFVSVVLPWALGVFYIADKKIVLAAMFFTMAICFLILTKVMSVGIDEISIGEYQDIYMRVNKNLDYTRVLQAYVTKDCQMDEANYKNFINLISSNKTDQYIKSLALPKSSVEVINMCSETVFLK